MDSNNINNQNNVNGLINNLCNIIKNTLLSFIHYLQTEINKIKTEQMQNEQRTREQNTKEYLQNIQIQLQYELYRVFSQSSSIYGLQKIQYVYDLIPKAFQQGENGILFTFSWQKNLNNIQPMSYMALKNLTASLNGIIKVYQMRLKNQLLINPDDTQLYNEFRLMLNTTHYYIDHCKDLSSEIQIVVLISW